MDDARADAAGLLGATNAVVPQPSASLVLIDRRGAQPKVLLGRRNFSLVFLPGKYAFPGGRLEADDHRMPAAGTLAEGCIARLALRRPERSPPAAAFALAAIREMYEETGLIVGSRAGALPASLPPAWRSFAEQGFAPNLAPLRFFARAITPPYFPRRFDTSFFLVEASAIAHGVDGHVGPDQELIETAWFSLDEARARDISRITAMILSELEAKLDCDSTEDFSVPFFHAEQQGWIREEL
jgi:8-oxo-dGTP pyrophosphatase MutT (NUDIX family)